MLLGNVDHYSKLLRNLRTQCWKSCVSWCLDFQVESRHVLQMSIFDIAAILIGLAALFGFLNHRYLKLPHTIGLMLIALAASSAVILTDTILPGSEMGKSISDLLARIDFHDIVMHGMLSFLLFAGALHVDFIAMADRKWTILTLATVGILISTFVIGTALWFVLGMLGLSLSLIWALVFGAL